MPSKGKIETIRVTINDRDQWKCWYCGMQLKEGSYDDRNLASIACLDHVIPKSRGGSDDYTNLVTCCRRCNSAKRNKTLEEYRAYIRYGQSDLGQAITHLRLAVQFAPSIHPLVSEKLEAMEAEIGGLMFYGEGGQDVCQN